jgi:hypothetical protein
MGFKPIIIIIMFYLQINFINVFTIVTFISGRRSSKTYSVSSSNSDSGSLTPRQSLDTDLDHESIRAKAFAALRQLNQRSSRSGGVQTIPIRGSKRRPLDVYEFYDDEDPETTPLKHKNNTLSLEMSKQRKRDNSKEYEFPSDAVTNDESKYYECKTCSKFFTSMQSFFKHDQGLCSKMLNAESSSDNDSEREMNIKLNYFDMTNTYKCSQVDGIAADKSGQCETETDDVENIS